MDGPLAGKKNDVYPDKRMEQTLCVESIYSAKEMVCEI